MHNNSNKKIQSPVILEDSNNQSINVFEKPEILAPAGDKSSFLAALSAGADAVYLGLKHFSARMQAKNFGISELSTLTELAHNDNKHVYIAMNTLVKPDDLTSAYRLIMRLERDVKPDALIIQDLAMLDLARQANFSGQIHLSTLANLSHPLALDVAKELKVNRVILPRELSIDEIKIMGQKCPENLGLELFVHGALCFCVSGRCYWSSYMGGKSGLRGRCVQPCRRVYSQGGKLNNMHNADNAKNIKKIKPRRSSSVHSGRFFSCLDLSIDVLSKTLLSIPKLISWKIEGRKKGPHYVYHVTKAYTILRDNPNDAKARKTAEEILQLSLGRPTCRARFLPQRDVKPTTADKHTSSGLLIGKIVLNPQNQATVKTQAELFPQDYLRIGVEDEAWHSTLGVSKYTPKNGSLVLRLPKHKTPKLGTPVYLIDRKEADLVQIINSMEKKLALCKKTSGSEVEEQPLFPIPCKKRRLPDIIVRSTVPYGKETRGSRNSLMALWVSPKSVQELSRTIIPKVSWWLPPVIWPGEEDNLVKLINILIRSNASHFVCNAPWQASFFRDIQGIDLIAGPFCNIANVSSLSILKDFNFAGAFVSPELSGAEYLSLPKSSPLPLGIVLSGFFPVGLARFDPSGLKPTEPFASPKGEIFWSRKYGSNLWIYPAWPLDLNDKRSALESAGYSFFAHIQEIPPSTLPESSRPGLFNWDETLL